jgi:hypothetical protein
MQKRLNRQEEARQRLLTVRLAGIAIGLALMLALLLTKRLLGT